MVNKLGIGSKITKWSNNEINFLKDNYEKYGAIYCSNELNRSLNSIRLKGNKLGLKYIYVWSDTEVKFLKDNYSKMGLNNISKCMGINNSIVKNKINELGLKYRDIKSFVKISNEVHLNKYDYSKSIYKGSNEKIIIICPEHGEFEQTAASHISGRGCPICCESKGERKIRKFLTNNNIKFIPQYTFNNCKNINKLPFDFYLPNYNLCVEYNGEQHYRPINYFGGYDTFNELVKRDKIKKEFCAENKVNLLIIRYDEPIISKLLDFLK